MKVALHTKQAKPKIAVTEKVEQGVAGEMRFHVSSSVKLTVKRADAFVGIESSTSVSMPTTPERLDNDRHNMREYVQNVTMQDLEANIAKVEANLPDAE